MIKEMPDDQYQEEVSQREKIRGRWGSVEPLSRFAREKAEEEAKLAQYGYDLIIWFNFWNYDSIRASYAVSHSGLNYVGGRVGNWIAYGFAPWDSNFAMMLKLRFGGL